MIWLITQLIGRQGPLFQALYCWKRSHKPESVSYSWIDKFNVEHHRNDAPADRVFAKDSFLPWSQSTWRREFRKLWAVICVLFGEVTCVQEGFFRCSLFSYIFLGALANLLWCILSYCVVLISTLLHVLFC